MKRISTLSVLTLFTMLALISTVFATPASSDRGTTQISGIAYYAAPGSCTDSEGDGSDYALNMTGDLSGCHYTFVHVSRCSPGGAYYEAGTETFVGMYNGGFGTFETNYVFTAFYRDCPTFTGEVAGRCQHPITAGSGTGIFEGATGRLDMMDDVATGSFPYRGHITLESALNFTGSRQLKNSIDLMGMSLGGGC